MGVIDNYRIVKQSIKAGVALPGVCKGVCHRGEITHWATSCEEIGGQSCTVSILALFSSHEVHGSPWPTKGTGKPVLGSFGASCSSISGF